MRTGVTGVVALLLLLAAIVIGYSSLFTVRETEQVLLVRLGEPVRVVTTPGLHYKAPFIDTVISLDKRILDLENPAQEVIASDQKRLVVDAFARYRIKDPLRFYQSIGTIQAANVQLATLLNSALRRVLGEATFIQVVRDERDTLMGKIRAQLDREAQGYGISVVDVRIRRADLPEQNSQAVYQRMQTERQREAAEFRAQGGQKAQEIRSKADREATVIIADANSQAEQIRGEGDGERAWRRPLVTDAAGGPRRPRELRKRGQRPDDFKHGDVGDVLAEAAAGTETEMKIALERPLAERRGIRERLGIEHRRQRRGNDPRAGRDQPRPRGALGDDRPARTVTDQQRQHRAESQRLIDALPQRFPRFLRLRPGIVRRQILRRRGFRRRTIEPLRQVPRPLERGVIVEQAIDRMGGPANDGGAAGRDQPGQIAADPVVVEPGRALRLRVTLAETGKQRLPRLGRLQRGRLRHNCELVQQLPRETGHVGTGIAPGLRPLRRVDHDDSGQIAHRPRHSRRAAIQRRHADIIREDADHHRLGEIGVHVEPDFSAVGREVGIPRCHDLAHDRLGGGTEVGRSHDHVGGDASGRDREAVH